MPETVAMTPGTLVLLHSPLTTASAWGTLPEALGAHEVVVPEVTDDDRPPYAGRYVARAALEISAAAVRPPVVLVAHGDAGPLLPPVGGGAARGASSGGRVRLPRRDGCRGRAGVRRRDRALVYVDRGAARGRHGAVRAARTSSPRNCRCRRTGRTRRAAICARRSAVEAEARQAGLRGWTVAEHPAGHFAAVDDPAGYGGGINALIAASDALTEPVKRVIPSPNGCFTLSCSAVTVCRASHGLQCRATESTVTRGRSQAT